MPLFAIGGEVDGVAYPFQSVFQLLAQMGLVLNNQQPHTGPSPCLAQLAQNQRERLTISPERPSTSTHTTRPSRRSEEHTSELQSLMRISYAVFCLKKKHQSTTTLQQHNT